MLLQSLETFFPGTRHVVLPVIHVDALGRNTESQLNLAMEAGADGVWLIDHHSEREWDLLKLTESLVRRYPTTWIGVNLLGWPAAKALRIAPETGAKGVWVDDAQIDERVQTDRPEDQAEAWLNWMETDPGFLLYFGGVAFKYQRLVGDFEKAASIAKSYMDVITSSGPGTGKAAELDKIQKLRKGLGPDGALAIASGLTIDNVESYLPYANVLMVATGISKNDHLDFDLTKAFIDKVRGFK